MAADQGDKKTKAQVASVMKDAPKVKPKTMELFGSEPKYDRIQEGVEYYKKLQALLMKQVK